VERWSLLGQSFGGFTALHYLTAFPEHLDAAYFTGGLPPVGRPVDDVYGATYAALRRLDHAWRRRFPEDEARLARVLDACDAGEVLLPGGEPVSRRLFRTIGHHLGMDGGADALHHLLELDPAAPAFRHDLAEMLPFGARNPIYAVLHESSYADGGATRWSAERVQPEDYRGDSRLLTGEHLFPWHFEDTPGLRPYREVAARLAEEDWPRLYDAERLAATHVPCAAVIYGDDPYVDRAFSEETADLLPGMRRWLTDEFLHGGLRTDGERVLDRLFALVREG
jgi:pimeloyl-ACP methyl ester carboxylesterase